jgi:hypothetical protein
VVLEAVDGVFEVKTVHAAKGDEERLDDGHDETALEKWRRDRLEKGGAGGGGGEAKKGIQEEERMGVRAYLLSTLWM